MAGHSFGGATALEFCHEDARCKAAVDLDGIPFGGVVADGLSTPTLFVLSDHSHEPSDASSRDILARIQSLYDRLPEGERGYVTIRNANHFSFSDQSRLNSQIATWLLRKAVGFGGLEARRGLTITTDLVHTFFDVHLNGADPAAIRDLSAKYPELEPGSSGAR
jgi:predicted dienelactone hydrolase